MKKAFQIILIGIVLSNCKGKLKVSEQKVNTKLDVDSLQREELRYTIINDAKQANFISQGDTISLWTPTKKQIDHFFLLTKESILANENKFSRYLKTDSLDNSYKQIICYIDVKGDSLVYINGLCRIRDYPKEDSTGNIKFYRQDWQNRLIKVDDGGDCYWYALINYTKKKVEVLSANGEA